MKIGALFPIAKTAFSQGSLGCPDTLGA
jgi:hypothetical protein